MEVKPVASTYAPMKSCSDGMPFAARSLPKPAKAEGKEGGVSYATVTTHAPPQTSEIVHRRPALITAVPSDSEATEELLSCQVNVGLIRSLRISTTTKYMIANELQWLRVSAEDDAGNLFSEAGVRSLAFDWRFEPEGFVTLIPPAQTLQQLPPELAALSESEARAYYTVPVHATAAPKRDEVRVRATLGAGHASARRPSRETRFWHWTLVSWSGSAHDDIRHGSET